MENTKKAVIVLMVLALVALGTAVAYSYYVNTSASRNYGAYGNYGPYGNTGPYGSYSEGESGRQYGSYGPYGSYAPWGCYEGGEGRVGGFE